LKSSNENLDAAADFVIKEAWREALGVSQIKLGQNFVRLGGDSLSAMRVVHDLRRDLGLTLTLTLIA